MDVSEPSTVAMLLMFVGCDSNITHVHIYESFSNYFFSFNLMTKT